VLQPACWAASPQPRSFVDDNTAAAPANADQKADSAAKESAQAPANEPSSEKPAAPPKAKFRLSPNQATLRDQVRKTLAYYQKMPFGTRQNNAGEIMDYCLPYGCATEISLYDASGERRANGITCLCWNYPSGGYEPLANSGGHISARLGYGVQSQPSQLLATLAFARVQANYPLRAGSAVRTVADLVEAEKLDCRAGADMSLKLIGLSYYAEDGVWKDDLGEEWSVEKILREELNLPSPSAGDRGLNRLLGLAYAKQRREKRNLPLEGQFARVEKYLDDFRKFAFTLQNTDGSWGYFLSARGANRDAAAQLRSTGYVLEWLAYSLPEGDLDDNRVTASVNCVVQGLNMQRNRSAAPNLPSREINAIAHSLHALSIYDDRFYQFAEEEKPANEKPAEKTAAKSGTAASVPRHSPNAGSSW
jgi:hypothetical protein